MQKITLGQTVYFHFALNDSSGSGAAGADYMWDVRLCGAAADAAPVMSGSGTLLSHANYPVGSVEVAIPATEGNGFAVNSQYAVFATASISSQNPTGFIGSFETETVGSVTAHFTNRTTDGNSTVETVNGLYSVHVTGTFDSATVLAIKGGTVGADPATFNTLRSFKAGQTRNMRLAGDVRFELTDAGGATSVSASLQQVIE